MAQTNRRQAGKKDECSVFRYPLDLNENVFSYKYIKKCHKAAEQRSQNKKYPTARDIPNLQMTEIVPIWNRLALPLTSDCIKQYWFIQ